MFHMVTCPHPRPYHTTGCSSVSFSSKLPQSNHVSFFSISNRYHQASEFLHLAVTSPRCYKSPSISAEVTSVGNGKEEDDEEEEKQEQLIQEEREISGLTDPGLDASGKTRRFPLENPWLVLDPPTQTPVRLLDEIEQMKLKSIMKWKVKREISKEQGKGNGGCIIVRALRLEQLGGVEDLLTDSYTELLWGPLTYRPALAWILASYLRERQSCLPHAVTLVALFSPFEPQQSPKNMNNDSRGSGGIANNVGKGDGNAVGDGVSTSNDDELDSRSQNWFLVGAVEISFNALGKPKDMQTPYPPIDAPFLSNMAVDKKFRRFHGIAPCVSTSSQYVEIIGFIRRGIGRELLRAAEELAAQMGCREMYLHCRMIDEAPLNMYKKFGYKIIETDSILSLLTLQRRRHLMRKILTSSYAENPM